MVLQPWRAWLEVMDTAVVSAVVVYVLLKQCYSDKRMLFKEIGSVHLRVCFPIRRVLVMSHYSLLVSDCSSTDCDPLVSSIITLQVYVPSSPSIR